MANDSPPPSNERVMWILYAALIASTFIYLFVLHQVMGGDGEMAEPLPEMAIALGCAALVVAAISVWLPRRLYEQAIDRMELLVEEEPDPDGSVMFRDKAPTVRVFSEPEKVRRRAQTAFFTPLILRLAMTEVVAIFGMVLGMTGHPWGTVLPFFVGSWVLFPFAAPTKKKIYGPIEQAFEARLPS